MRATVEAACGIGADGVVLHVGSHLGSGFDGTLKRVVPALRELLELADGRTWILLENTAGAGGTIGRSVEELAALVDALDRHERLGICLDSCHWWASGVDVTDRVALDAALAELDERIGLERLRCLHVNDSQTPLGSNRDRHASVGEGLMGDGLGVFLAHPAVQKLPAILETPAEEHAWDAADIERVRDLHRHARRRRPRARR
jgi:deoxyribonuclease-4